MRTLQNTLETKVAQIISAHIGPIDFDIYDDDSMSDFLASINLSDYTTAELSILFAFNWALQAKASDLNLKEVYVERVSI